MFGNRLGWGISALMWLAAAYLVYAIVHVGEPSPPTGWATVSVHTLQLPAGADAVLPGMTDTRDAADFYRLAIDDYNNNPDAYAALEKVTAVDEKTKLPGIAAILEATPCAKMNLFRGKPEEVVKYDVEKEPLEALYHVAQIVKRLALLYEDKKPAMAARHYAALFSLGVKMYQERVVYDELVKGEDLMGTGVNGLRALAVRAKNGKLSAAASAFEDARLADYTANIEPVWTVISSIDDDTIERYAGDMFLIAKDKSFDSLWRVEAAMKVGRLRFNAGRIGDQVAARRFLRSLANDPAEDPAVRAAAAAGRDLKIEQYRQLR